MARLLDDYVHARGEARFGVGVFVVRGFVVGEFVAVGGRDGVFGGDVDVAAAGAALVDGAFGLRAAGLAFFGDGVAVFVLESWVFAEAVFVGEGVEVGDGECYADSADGVGLDFIGCAERGATYFSLPNRRVRATSSWPGVSWS